MKNLFISLILISASIAAFAFAGPIYTCSARSLIGRFYYVSGPDEGIARDQAIAECENHSFICYSTGCSISAK